jgi:3-hydroxybutyryl-CoA dehydrogenase
MPEMTVYIWADQGRQSDLMQRKFPEGINCIFSQDPPDTVSGDLYQAYFFLTDTAAARAKEINGPAGTPVFVHAVNETLAELGGHPALVRINAWPGFLCFPLLEISGADEIRPKAEQILSALDWRFEWVPDIPGMITPRVIAMLVNEASFAVGEGVSTPNEMDIAMKLGTNYPLGPFEWVRQISTINVLNLLTKLAEKDPIYHPAPGLNSLSR